MRRHHSPHWFLVASVLATCIARADDRTQFTLPNGLRVRLLPNHQEKKVVVLLGVRAGFFDEPAGRPHLAHVAEHCLVFSAPEGTSEAKALAQWFEAGQSNAETLANFMYFDLEVPAEQLPKALRVQADRLVRPHFSAQVLEREIPNALSEIDFLEQSPQGGPAKFAYMAFAQAALHGQNDLTIRATTRAFTVSEIREFHARTFRPDRAVLCVIGDFEPTLARQAIETGFKAFSRSEGDAPAREQPKAGSITARWDIKTRHVVLAWPAPKPTDPDHAALSLATLLLMQRLYTDPEITKPAKLPMVSNDVEGLFIVNVQVAEGADADSLQNKLLGAIGQVARGEGLGDGDVALLRMAFAQQLGPVDVDTMVLPANVSKMMARANIELQQMSKEIAWGDLTAYAERLDKLSWSNARAALARYLDPKKATIVRIEPAK